MNGTEVATFTGMLVGLRSTYAVTLAATAISSMPPAIYATGLPRRLLCSSDFFSGFSG